VLEDHPHDAAFRPVGSRFCPSHGTYRMAWVATFRSVAVVPAIGEPAAPILMAGLGGRVTPRECVARTRTRGARYIAFVRRLCPVPVFASASGVPSSASRPCTRTRDPSTVITDAVQADGVGPAGRAGAEDSRWRTVRVIAGAGDEHVAAGPVEPGQHHDLSTGPKIADPFGDLRLKHEPRRRCAQVALPWRLRPVFQW
jgi:hypothetical protein